MAAKKKKKKKVARKQEPATAPGPQIATAPLTDEDRVRAEALYDKVKRGDLHINELQRMSPQELQAVAEQEGMGDLGGLTKQDLIFRILKDRVEQDGLLFGEGVLEVLPDGFGFLRSPLYSYTASPDDIYVSPSQIRRLALRNGSFVSGQIRPPKDGERYFALLKVEAVNQESPEKSPSRPTFEDLTPLYPDERFILETTADCIETRIMDLLSPIGKGQRGLIVSPPRAGKTIILQLIANAITANHPEARTLASASS